MNEHVRFALSRALSRAEYNARNDESRIQELEEGLAQYRQSLAAYNAEAGALREALLAAVK